MSDRWRLRARPTGLPPRGPTWDVIPGGFGPDVAVLDEALGAAFAAPAGEVGRPEVLVSHGVADLDLLEA